MNTYALIVIPEYQSFKHNTQTRDLIVAEKGVEGLAQFLLQQVLHTHDPVSHLKTQDTLMRQLMKDYTGVQIATAIAQAWISDSDTFSLPKVGFVEKHGKVKLAAILAITIVVVACIILFTLFTYELRYAISFFIGFEPLLALPLAALAYVLYELIMKLWK